MLYCLKKKRHQFNRMLRQTGLSRWQIRRRHKNGGMRKLGILSLISSVVLACYEDLLEDRPDLSEKLRQVESECWEFRNAVCRAVDTVEGISAFWLC